MTHDDVRVSLIVHTLILIIYLTGLLAAYTTGYSFEW